MLFLPQRITARSGGGRSTPTSKAHCGRKMKFPEKIDDGINVMASSVKTEIDWDITSPAKTAVGPKGLGRSI
jgi:hypothetical protein